MTSHEIWNLAVGDLDDLRLSDERKSDAVRRYMSRYVLCDETVFAIRHAFERQMEEGLQNQVQDPTALGMKLSFFTELFDGTEEGSFVVIHITSRHLVLTLAEVKPGFSVATKSRYFTVSELLRRSPYLAIFEYACECLLEFFGEHGLLGSPQKVGFCSTDLSTVQTAVGRGTVCFFTDAGRAYPLNCYDLTRCFEIALLKRKFRDVRVRIVAMVTDAVAEFAAAAYVAGDVDVFLGDCALAYMEDVRKVGKWKLESSTDNDSPERVLIDTELGRFGLNGCLEDLCTEQDWLTLATPLDLLGTVHKHANLQTFLSEKYVMELIKHIMLDLNHELLYCRHAETGSLQERGVSLTDICNLLASEPDLEHATSLLPGGTVGGCEDDARVAIYVIRAIIARMSLLLAIVLSSVFMRFNAKEDFVVVARNNLLKSICETQVRELVSKLAPGKKFQLLWAAEEPSVVKGAALATAVVANRLERSAKSVGQKDIGLYSDGSPISSDGSSI